MRKVVKLIKKDEDLGAILKKILEKRGYPGENFLIIQHSAL